MDVLAREMLAVLRADDPGQQLLTLIADPFSSELQTSSIWASLASSIGISAAIALGFSLVRPYNTVVYAPKLKHADEYRAPPPLGKGIFAWIMPLWRTNEKDILRYAGMDAAIFLRFINMCRNMFVVMAVIGCGILVPINYTQSVKYDSDSWLYRLTPQNVYDTAQWGTVIAAWLFDIVVCGFLWWNYRKVLQLRREYFESQEYQSSLHARSLMLYDIPKKLCSDEGIARIIDSVAPNSSFARTALARDVKVLPELISQHDSAVRKLESVLAKYLKDPQNLPPARPMCMPSKKDRSYSTYPKGQKVDAIEYLTQRIKQLEFEIKDVRMSVDKRNTKPFGFASYADISEAHAIAYMARNKKPTGAFVKLAPRPHDIIWDNMPLNAATRARRRLIINLWIALLTVIWIAPNAMIAIFLVNLSNLGSVWPAFQTSLQANSTFWSIVQGIASPAVTSLIFLVLPIVFRRLSIRAGDQTKSGRERHVIAKLYSFFVFNNLIVFSLFSALWAFTSKIIEDTNTGTDAWTAILKQNVGQTVMVALCHISPFWVTYLLQRQLSAAIDLAQLWKLGYSFIMRKASSPTPREMIELTAPPSFEYASYYNYFLFYATVALAYATIQPLVLPCAALYFAIDCVLKKYLLMYIFITKNESGGMSWRVIFNRFIFATVFSNLIAFLVTWVRGGGEHHQAYAVAALPFLVIGFKVYCAKTFDHKIHYYNTRFVGHGNEPDVGVANKENLRNDRLASKFGHPVLYKPLTTPMVHARAQNILASVYQGRLTDGRDGAADGMSVSGYSDMYALDSMKAGQPGKSAAGALSGFELVPEGKLDFEYYKNRSEFAEDHGQGELFGAPSDIVRSGTPSIYGGSDADSRPGTPVGGMGFSGHNNRRNFSPAGGAGDSPYGQEYGSPKAAYSPKMTSMEYPPRTQRSSYGLVGASDSNSNLIHSAAPMASPPIGYRDGSRSASIDHGDLSMGRNVSGALGGLGGGPSGYGNLPQNEPDYDPTSYNYFRGGRRTDGGV